MFLHIGNDVLVRVREIIVIVNYKPDDRSRVNIGFLQRKVEEGRVRDLTEGNAKSMVVTQDERVYFSPVSAQALKARWQKKITPGGFKEIDGRKAADGFNCKW